MKEFIPNSL